MAPDTWNNAGDEPGRLTHLDDRNDRAVLVQGSGGPAQIVELLCHESAPSFPAPMVTWRHRRPHSISWPDSGRGRRRFRFPITKAPAVVPHIGSTSPSARPPP